MFRESSKGSIMKVFGHHLIKAEEFYTISKIEDIEKTPPNSIVLISNFNIEIATYCKKNLIPYAIKIDTIKDAIFANLLDAKYMICFKELGKKIMPIAQNYLFDTEVLVEISNDSEIEDLALIGVDGVIYLLT